MSDKPDPRDYMPDEIERGPVFPCADMGCGTLSTADNIRFHDGDAKRGPGFYCRYADVIGPTLRQIWEKYA